MQRGKENKSANQATEKLAFWSPLREIENLAFWSSLREIEKLAFWSCLRGIKEMQIVKVFVYFIVATNGTLLHNPNLLSTTKVFFLFDGLFLPIGNYSRMLQKTLAFAQLNICPTGETFSQSDKSICPTGEKKLSLYILPIVF